MKERTVKLRGFVIAAAALAAAALFGSTALASDTEETERISGVPSAVSVSVSHATAGTEDTRILATRGA